jgi:DNA-binding transcriptional regulator YiaG
MSQNFSDLLDAYLEAKARDNYMQEKEARDELNAFFEVPDLLTPDEDCVPADPGAAPVSGPTLAVLVGDREQMLQNTLDTFLPLHRRTDSEMEKKSRLSPGDRLRWLRLKSGRSMGDLARFLNCSVVEISQIERGVSVQDVHDHAED